MRLKRVIFCEWINSSGSFGRFVENVDANAYNTQSVKEIIDEPERASKYTLDLTHVQIDIVAICFAEEEGNVWIVGVYCVHVVDILG